MTARAASTEAGAGAPPAGAGAGALPRLSVAICTRNRPEKVGRALRSLLSQSRPPLEILIVDNAPCDDATRTLVAREFPQVRYLREPVRGLDAARNLALRAAAGEVVAFLDDDAVADRDWAAAILAPFADPRVGASTGRVEAFEDVTDGQRLIEASGGYSRGCELVRLPRDARRPLHGHRAPLIAWAVSVGSGCSMAVRRALALQLGGFDEALDTGAELPGGGDHDMLWRVLQAGYDLVYEPTALAHHEHRRAFAGAVDQLIGHQRALVAFLVKTVSRTPGRKRLPLVAFVAWRLLKPGLRLARRALGRDPLPASVLLRMWAGCWAGLAAYPASSRAARRRREQQAGLPAAQGL